MILVLCDKFHHELSKGIQSGGTKWERVREIGHIFGLYLVVSPKRCKIRLGLLLNTNRKSHTGFRSIGTKVDDLR